MTQPDKDWLPIETAPKDGTWIIAYRPDPDGWYDTELGITICRWRKNDRTGKSYFTDTYELDDYELADYPPTHWMPLPEPPSDE